jgi:hypothetical protein
VFDKWLSIQYNGASKENFTNLEELLLDPSLELVLAIRNTLNVADKEDVAKALIFLFSYKQSAISLLNKFIDEEIKACDGKSSSC